MKPKKIIIFLIVICMISVLTGCQSKQDDKNGKPYVIMVNALNGISVYEQQSEAARKAADDYGVNLEILGPSASDNLDTAEAIIAAYKSEMEKAISKKPDAIICEPFEPSLFESVVSAKNAGIPVFCTSSGTDNENDYISCCGTDNAHYGKLAADLIAEKMNNAANVLAVMSAENVSNQTVQLEEFKKQCVEKYPNVKVVATVTDEANSEKAVTVFRKSFAENTEINAVLMLESVGGQSAAAVAKEMKRNICILDIDASKETIDNIVSEDEWATLAQNFFKRGYETVRMAYEYIKHDGKVEYSKFEDSSAVLITKENATNYEKTLWADVRIKGVAW